MEVFRQGVVDPAADAMEASLARLHAEDARRDDIERVAVAIAEAVGSRVFEPLHDTVEDQRVRDRFRHLARQALVLSE